MGHTKLAQLGAEDMLTTAGQIRPTTRSCTHPLVYRIIIGQALPIFIGGQIFLGGLVWQGLEVLFVGLALYLLRITEKMIAPDEVPLHLFKWSSSLAFLVVLGGLNLVFWTVPLVAAFLLYWYFAHFAPHHDLVGTGIVGATLLKLAITFGIPFIKGLVTGQIFA